MKRKKLWLVLAILGVIGIAYFAIGRNQRLEVETFPVEKGKLEKYIEEVGIVKMEQQTTIYASEGGKVAEILVQVGDQVKAGDILAKLNEKELSIQLEGLKAEKEAAMAQYQEALKPSDGQVVRKMQAAVKSATVSYEEAKRAADNSRRLYEEGAVSYETYRSALANLHLQEAALESAKSDLEMVEKGISTQQRKQYEARISQIQSQIDLLYQKKENLIIRAPREGMVMAKAIETGTYIQPGMALFEIGNRDDLYIESDILIREIGEVTEGAPVVIWSDDLGIKDLKGVVRKIYPKAFSKISDLGIEQKRVKIEIDFSEAGKGGKLKPDYEVDIRIITQIKPEVLWIPENAVFEYEGNHAVFVNQKGTAVLRKIEKGIESGERVEIVKGLQQGEEVILSPNEKIKQGIQIQKKNE
ncbi:efflux RND transporter periplasmic adaptor subunit [Thermotalea metallivorans]|uniref:Putative efflux system component YknX n=1 Tax=Thermotalea metallivorans TaxID=520762 RepID=A0A140L7F5_9FIRM|nr:efflux RND transporter periplasmic adaptor subunit [Thermotalea metallivorans]KXG76480.1 putative efflux system component YknX [Thermotalea metallivorans]